MDEMKPPQELKDLWMGGQPREENVEMVLEQVFRGAQKFKDLHRGKDVFGIIAAMVVIPSVLLMAPGADPVDLPALLGAAVVMAACWWNRREFQRSVGQEPTPNRTTQEHLAWFLTYMDGRERLYRANDKWGNVVFPMAIVITIALGGTFSAALLAVGWWAGRAMTKSVLRQIAEERGKVRQMRDELAA